jgi:hypothetical protein
MNPDAQLLEIFSGEDPIHLPRQIVLLEGARGIAGLDQLFDLGSNSFDGDLIQRGSEMEPYAAHEHFHTGIRSEQEKSIEIRNPGRIGRDERLAAEISEGFFLLR